MKKMKCGHMARVGMEVVVGVDPRTGGDKKVEVCVGCAGKLFGKGK